MRNYLFTKLAGKPVFTGFRRVFAAAVLGTLMLATGAKGTALNGTYTIDPTSGNYKTFTLAVTDLKNNGVSGPVTFNVSAATFSETVTFAAIAGVSATNTIKFVGKGRSSTILTSTGATLNISSQSYITFDQMSIITTATSGDLVNAGSASHCTFTNCILKGATTGSGYIVFGNLANYLTLNNDYIYGGQYGLYSYGKQADSTCGYLSCTNTRFAMQVTYGYYSYYCYRNYFAYNVIDSSVSSLTYGIVNEYENGPVITGNKVYAKASYAMYMYYENYYPVTGKPQTAVITNNFFTNGTTDGVYDEPMNLTSSSGGWIFAFNTIYNTSATSYGAFIEPYNCGSGICTFASNIIYSTKGTDALYMENYNTNFLQYDGNDIYFTTGSIIFYNGTTSTTYASYATYIAAVQGRGYDLNGSNFNPAFVSTVVPFDLHLSSAVAGPAGVQTSGITTDIDRNSRFKITAAGAAECFYGTANNNAAVLALVSPVAFCAGTQTISVKVENMGLNQINSVIIGWSWDGVLQSPVTYGSTITFPSGDATVALGTESFASGVLHKLKAWPITTNSSPNAGVSPYDTLNLTIAPSLNGSYTINPSGGTGGTNFTSFGSAANALNSYGVCGPVYFTVSKTTYKEQVQLNKIAGTSDTNTVTFDGVDSSRTILTYTGTAASPFALQLNGSKYVTFERMSVVNPSTAGAVGVYLTNNASNNTISNCIIKVDNSVTNTGTIIAIGIMGASYTAAGNNGNNNTINNNIIIGGWANVQVYGTSATNLCTGNNITNNNMSGAYIYGVNCTYQGGFVVSGNTISLRITSASGTVITSGGCIGSYTGGYGTSTYGVSATSCTTHTISGNRINAMYAGIYDAGADVSITGGKSMIYNNVVLSMYSLLYPSVYGIYLNVGYNTQIYYNTVYFNSVGTALNIVNTGATAAQGVDVRNNIIYKTAACGVCASVATASWVSNFDYNDYYSLGGSFVSFGGAAYTSLVALQAGNPLYNQHSYSVDPGFVSLVSGKEDFHMSSYGLYGTDVGIYTDLDGNSRCKTFPNIGAYESSLGKAKPTVKFFISSNVYPGSPSYVYQTGKAGSPQTYQWILNGVLVSDSVVLKTTQFVAGFNDLKLIVYSCTGKDSFEQVFKVTNPTNVPVTNFVASQNDIPTGTIVNFEDLSTNGPTTWHWTITPDSTIIDGSKTPAYQYYGSTSTSQNPQVQFLNSGLYNVCLTTYNSIGKGVMLCKNSYINVLPAVNLGSANITTASEGYLYDDGGPNGNYLNNKATPYILIAPCADSVYLTFSMFDMNCGVSFVQLFEGRTATGKRLDPCGGSGINSGFSGGGSSSINCATACLPNVTKPDTFKAKSAMFIQMNDGSAASGKGFAAHWWTKPLAGVKKPKASFTTSANNDSNCEGFIVNFTNTSILDSGDVATYYWDLDGDLTTFECVGACQSAYWPYFLPGTVPVTLIASSCGGVDSFTKDLTIYSPVTPKANIGVDNTNPAANDVVYFNAPIQQCVEDYKWTISKTYGSSVPVYVNNTTAYMSNPEVIFTDTGYYSVKLVVDNASGSQKDSITKVKYIYVKPAYCVPDVATLIQAMGISRVRLNTLTNSMIQGQQGYINYTNDRALTTTLAQGLKYPISISRDSGLIFDPLNRSVFIDWNQDGSFTGTGEEAAEDSNGTSATWTGTITVPKTAKLGATTMRVAVNLGSLSNKPCGQNEFGAYQDYRIYIEPFNIPPVITLNGHHGLSDTIVLEMGNQFVEAGYSASSYLYGNLTKNVVRTSRLLYSSNPGDSFSDLIPGIYIYSYNLKDSAGNKAITQYRVVKLDNDTTPPLLIVDKPDTTILEVTATPQTFTPPIVISAYDVVDGDLSLSVLNDAANVTTNIVGFYTVTYTVSDISGNVAKVYRYVKIVDTLKPVLHLIGNGVDTVQANITYVDNGVTVTDNYYPTSDLTPLIVKSDSVNVNVLGTYTVTYTLTDPSGNVAVPVTRKIVVVDTVKPVIKLNGLTSDTMPVFTKYKDPGTIVTDKYWGTTGITVNTTGSFYTKFPTGMATLLGTYNIIYTATDNSGNKATVGRNVTVIDNIPPVISLKGSADTAVCRWANYQDQGYAVTDNYDNISNITVDTLGTFVTNGGTTIENFLTLYYRAKDKSGNVSYSATRNILVKSKDEWPCSTLGINPALSIDKYISVFPNPNSGTFTVKSDLPEAMNVRITIMDLLGREVAVVNNGLLQYNTFKVDLGNNSAGIYFMNIISNEQKVTRKITVTR